MFSNLRIGARLAVGFGAVLVITAVMGFVGIYNAARFAEQTARLGENTRGAAYLADAESALWQLRWDVAQFIAVTDDATRRKLADNGPIQRKVVEDNLRRFEDSQRSAEEVAAVKELRDNFEQYMGARPKWFELYGAGKLEEAADWRARTITTFGANTVKSFGKVIALQREASEKAELLARDRVAQSRNALIALLVAAIVLGFAIAFGTTRSITRPLDAAVSVAQEVATGNLVVDIDARTRDETGRLMEALAHMRDGLHEAVGTIRSSAESVGTASRQIAMGSSEMSSRVEEQAASLEESASSMEELTTAVKQNAENAGRANELAMGASEVAARGGAAMAQVTSTMGGISHSSRKIGDIIAVIDGIAFQTNILALNAAVEAARAGEQGRGFAVVASEVRGLAQRCAEAAKEIKRLIEESGNRVDDGKRLVETAGKTMEEIVASVDRVKGIMGEISTASREQLSGIEQVGNAVMQMDRMTQQNAALVGQTATAADNMASQAEQLVAAVARFRVGDAVVAHAARPARAQPAPIAAATPHRALAMAQRTAIAHPVRTPAVAGAGAEDWREF